MTTQFTGRNFQSLTPKRRRQKLLSVIALLTWGIVGLASPGRVVAADNMALGRPYTLEPKPNYGPCTDPDDPKQLTDGVYSAGTEAPGAPYIWAQKSTVGWQNASPVIITIDLGQSQPIGGVSFSTAARLSVEVAWPQELPVFVSDDAKSWRFVGDLVALSARHQQPPVAGPHRFATHDLRARGRFVSVAVVSTGFTFCDEIEVYRGPDSVRDEESPITENIHEFVELNHLQFAVTKRLADDLALVRKMLGEARLSSPINAKLDARLQEAEAGIAHLPPTAPEGFKAILPLNPTHAKILGVYGALLEARGLPALFAGKQHRYAYLPWLAIPSKEEPKLSVEMMKNEFRADSFLLTNASDAPAQVTIRVTGLPGVPQPDWLSLSVVPWTDTCQFRPVADALVEAEYAGGSFHCTVPAGLTLKMWLSVDSSKLPAGVYEGALRIEKKPTALLGGLGLVRPVADIPLSVRVSPVRMARPRLSLYVFDYTNGAGHNGITPKNREAALALMRSHFVDSPWALAEVLPQTRNPSFTALDEWIKRWPEARRYFVFANAPDHFGGAKIGTPEFAAGVGAWAKAIAGHLRELGLAPQQLAVCLVGEPKDDQQDWIIAAWARAIKAATPELAIFEDTRCPRPDQTKSQEAITLADIVCPDVSVFLKGGAPVAEYFAARRAAGQSLWFYQCAKPVRHFDPQGYYREAAWLAFQHEADGIGFWAFGDLGGVRDSWNEYTAKARFSFAPAFIGMKDATDSIHWQAVREGIEDHECLAMVRDAAGQSGEAAWKGRAGELLNEARTGIAYPAESKYGWELAADPGLVDACRLRALKLLEENKNQPRGGSAP